DDGDNNGLIVSLDRIVDRARWSTLAPGKSPPDRQPYGCGRWWGFRRSDVMLSRISGVPRRVGILPLQVGKWLGYTIYCRNLPWRTSPWTSWTPSGICMWDSHGSARLRRPVRT